MTKQVEFPGGGGDKLPDQAGASGKYLQSAGSKGTEVWASPAGSGDMLEVVYDPGAVGDDAFDMDNMVEGANLILSGAERTKLAAIAAGADVTADELLGLISQEWEGAYLGDPAGGPELEQLYNQGEETLLGKLRGEPLRGLSINELHGLLGIETSQRDFMNSPAGGAELEEVTAGPEQNADNLHTHEQVTAVADALQVRNTSGSTIVKGAPVYVTGWSAGHARPTVDLADADDPAKMPAIGCMGTALPNNSNGLVIVAGIIMGTASATLDTSGGAVEGGVWVSTTAGAVVYTRPTIDEIQRIGTVLRSHATLGSMLVVGAGRSNDVPIIIPAGTTFAAVEATRLGLLVETRTASPAFMSRGQGPADIEHLVSRELPHFGTRGMMLTAVEYATDCSVADNLAHFHVPPWMHGMNLIYAHARCITAGTTGTMTVEVYNTTQTAQMLSTNLTIDTGETGSDTAAAPHVIDLANDHLAENDLVTVNISGIHTTAAKGLIVTLGFQLP